MKVIADTASLISPVQGESKGISVIPVSVSINGNTYKDYTQISTEEFLNCVAEGGIPGTSQPAIGDVLDVYEADEEEVLFVTIGDGLSGAYQTAMSARNLVDNPDRIHVINSKTLAGPLNYLVMKAVALKKQGLDMAKIKSAIETCVESSISFVIPEDFEFLKRSGRLAPIAAKIGSTLKLLPVLTQTKDKRGITPLTIKRSWNSAVEAVIQKLQSLGVGEDYFISVCHAGTPQKAKNILENIKQHFEKADTDVMELSPGLVTHGGPGCIVIQAIRK